MTYLKTSLALMITCFGFIFQGIAQPAGKIEGTVLNAQGKPQSATATLQAAADTSALKQVATNAQGAFVFEQVPAGNYRVSITAVGFQKALTDVISISEVKPVVIINAINLQPAGTTMGNVTVTATRPMIEQHTDKMVLNVDASITNAGATAFDILEKAPGVTVDQEGNISLKGKESVIILIDGRPAQLSGPDLANMLRSMTSNQLDQVEIMTNPPARFDAAGNAGVINIKTKKIEKAGYNGNASVNYMQGRYPRANEGFNFNYRVQKVNLYASLGHIYQRNFEELTIQRNLRDDNNILENYFDQAGRKMTKGQGWNVKAGIDFFATKKTTLGMAFQRYQNNISVVNQNNTTIFDASKETESITKASVDNENSWNRVNGNMYMRMLLNKPGRELTADLDVVSHRATQSLYMINAYPYRNGGNSGSADTLLGDLPQNIDVYSGRVDYTHPLAKNARFEAGIKSSLVQTDNNARYDSLINGNLVLDANRSNHFIYKENINAVYVNWVKPINKKWSTQLGLRMENTNAIGRQLTEQKNFDRHYTQLFPTAYLQYKANEKNTLTANIGRRVQRPNYQSLNPFIRFIDRYTFNEGNPNLRPAISNNVELTHNYLNKLITTLNYTATNDIINSVLEQKGRVAYARPENIASLKQVGISVSANNQLAKWWSSNININAFYNDYKGVVNGIPIDRNATSYILMVTQQFKFGKHYSAELSGRYRSGWIMGVMEAKPIGFIWAGVGRQIMKNQGSIRLTVRDIFYTQKFKATSRYGNVDFAMQEINDSRMVVLGFSYRFSKGKKVAPVKRTAGSATEEQERIEQ